MKLSVSGFEVSEKDLQDQQREYSPQAHPEPASTISGSATTFLTISYARHPIYTSYTSTGTLTLGAILGGEFAEMSEEAPNLICSG